MSKALWLKNFHHLCHLNILVVLNINTEVCWNVSEKNSCTVIDETIQNQMVYSGYVIFQRFLCTILG